MRRQKHGSCRAAAWAGRARVVLAIGVGVLPVALPLQWAGDAGAETPQVLSWISADVDGDGRPDTLTLRADGKVAVEWAGGTSTTLTFSGVQALGRPAQVQFSETAAGRFILATATEVRPRRGAGHALAALLRAGQPDVVYDGAVGPVGRDGEYAVDVALSPAGLIRYQTAPTVRRCDGERRLFVERFRDGAGWGPYPDVTLPPAGAPAKTLAATGNAPAELQGAPLGVYRWVAASAQAGVSRADSLGPPRELEDANPASAWAPAPGQLRGAFVTAQADGSGHSVRALRLQPATGKPLPSRVTVVFSDRVRFDVDLPAASTTAQWLTFAAADAPQADCVSLVVRDGAAGAALGDVAIYSELDGGGGLAALVSQVARAEGSAGEGAARTLMLRARQDARSRAQVLDAVASTLGLGAAPASGAPSAPAGEGMRRLQDVLMQLSDGDGADDGATAARLQELLWGLLGRRLAAGTATADDRQALLVRVARLRRLGPSLLGRVVSEGTLPVDVRAAAMALFGAAASDVAAARLLPLVGEAARTPALAAGLSAGLAAALRCRPASDAGMASALATMASGDGATQALLVGALSQAMASCSDGAVRVALANRLVQIWPVGEGDGVFVLRLRLLQALDRLAAPTPEGQALVQTILNNPADPELRQLASRLRVRQPGPSDDRWAGLRDPDPGVRLATLATFATVAAAPGGAGAAAGAVDPARLDEVLLRDGWPKVRRAAVEARAAACRETVGGAAGGGPVRALREALSDRDGEVQRRALAALGRCEGSGAVELFIGVAEGRESAPGQRGLACSLIARHGFGAAALAPDVRARAHAAAATTLTDLLHEPMADDRYAAALVQCLRGFEGGGDSSDVPALLDAAGADSPAVVRQSAVAAVAAICSRRSAPGAVPLSAKVQKALESRLRELGGGEEGRVKASARRAAQACGVVLP